MNPNRPMTAAELVNIALTGRALGVSVEKATKSFVVFAITTFERGVDKVRVHISTMECMDLANLAAKSHA